MLLKTYKAIKFEAVTVEESNKSGVPSLDFNVTWSVLANKKENSPIFDNCRIRFFAAFDTTSAQTLDFLSQRFNEYQLADATGQLPFENTPSGYVSFLRKTLKGDMKQYLSRSLPFSPYDVTLETVQRMFAANEVLIGHGKSLPNNVAMWDRELDESLLKTGSGEIAQQRSNYNGSIPVADPRLPATVTSLVEGLGTDASRSLNGMIVNEVMNTNSYGPASNESKMFLSPLKFKLAGVSLNDLPQITLYAFIYSTFQPATAKEITAWGSISTPLTSVTLKGLQYLWARTSPTDLFSPMMPSDPSGAPATSAGIFHHLDDGIMGRIQRSLHSSWYDFFKDQPNQITDLNPDFKGVVKDNFSFSDLWLSHGTDNTSKFVFAVDEADILRRNSVLPSFYTHPELIKHLFSGKKEETGLSEDIEPSHVIEIGMKRRLHERLPIMPSNDVSTSAHLTPLGPSLSFPDKYLGLVKPVDNISGFTDNKVLRFYEGEDDFSEETISNLVSYSADVTAYDAAPFYLRAMVKQIMLYYNDINRICDGVLDTATNSTEGGVILLRPLSSFEGNFSDGRLDYMSAIATILTNYTKLLNLTLRTEPLDIQPYLMQIRSLEDNMPIEWLYEIKSIVLEGLNFYYHKLKSVFPSDPLGDNVNRQLSMLRSVGSLRNLYPVIEDTHSFNQSFEPGSRSLYGQDYMFSKKENHHPKSLMMMPAIDVKQRFNMEFNKYFQPAASTNIEIGRVIPILPTDSPPDFSPYLSPKTIFLPHQKPLDQTEYLKDRSAPYVKYDLDKYAHLFSQLISVKTGLNNFIYGTGETTEVTAISQADCADNTAQGAESLYSSIVSQLVTDHGVVINETLVPEYKAPAVSSGEYEKTSGLSSALTYLPGPDMITSIVGGTTEDSETETYVDSVETTLTNPSEDQQDLQKSLDSTQEFKRPLKLPFALFGELSIDPSINLDVTYQEKEFNSLKNIANAFGINNLNIVQMLEGPFSTLPVQMKSMLIIATSTEAGKFYDQDPEGPYEACRPVLEDKNSSKNIEELVSFWEKGSNQPDYSSTIDPMKIYAKFLAFWLNYKQLGTLQCLTSFVGNTTSLMPNVARDRWTTFTQEIVDNIPPGEKLLCRVVPFSKETLKSVLPPSEACEAYITTSFGKPQQSLEMPLYNQYFYIESSQEGTDEIITETTTAATEGADNTMIYSPTQTNYY